MNILLILLILLFTIFYKNIESIREFSCFDVGGTYVIPEEGLKDLGYTRTVAKE